MKSQGNAQVGTVYDVQVEISRVEKLLRRIAKDKSLPTFGNFFIHCVISGNAEKVNLKVMFPELYRELNDWIKAHTAKVKAARNSNRV